MIFFFFFLLINSNINLNLYNLQDHETKRDPNYKHCQLHYA